MEAGLCYVQHVVLHFVYWVSQATSAYCVNLDRGRHVTKDSIDTMETSDMVEVADLEV